MNHRIFIPLLFLFTITILSCSGTKKAGADKKEATFWINSSYHEQVVIHEQVGVMAFGNCYAISDPETFQKEQFGFINAEWRALCGEIAGFEYQEGFIYQVTAQKTRNDKRGDRVNADLSDWELIKVLSKEKDVHYERREVLTAWIGPQMIKVPCGSPMAPPDCRELRHMAQFGELNKNGDWKPLYDLYELPDFEEGHIYKVRYTKVHMSEFELRSIADHRGFEIEDLRYFPKRNTK